MLKSLLKRRFATTTTPSLPIVYYKTKVPIYIYSQIEQEELLNQLIDLADSGIAEHYVSVMPDVHLGKGATVGTVFASSNYVCPNAVGVDIGCGMCAIPLDDMTANPKKAGGKVKLLTEAWKEQIFK